MKDYQGHEIVGEESPDKAIKVWCIEPHQDDEYDYCIVRDYYKAIKIAQSTVAWLMDMCDDDETIEVKIWVKTMPLGDYQRRIEDTQ